MEETRSYRQHCLASVLGRYEFCEVRNAAAILASTSSMEWAEIMEVLRCFELGRDDILGAGGNKSESMRPVVSWKFVFGACRFPCRRVRMI